MIYKEHGSKFKLKVALEAIKGKKTVAEICQEYGITGKQIHVFKFQDPEGAF